VDGLSTNKEVIKDIESGFSKQNSMKESMEVM